MLHVNYSMVFVRHCGYLGYDSGGCGELACTAPGGGYGESLLEVWLCDLLRSVPSGELVVEPVGGRIDDAL